MKVLIKIDLQVGACVCACVSKVNFSERNSITKSCFSPCSPDVLVAEAAPGPCLWNTQATDRTHKSVELICYVFSADPDLLICFLVIVLAGTGYKCKLTHLLPCPSAPSLERFRGHLFWTLKPNNFRLEHTLCGWKWNNGWLQSTRSEQKVTDTNGFFPGILVHWVVSRKSKKTINVFFWALFDVSVEVILKTSWSHRESINSNFSWENAGSGIKQFIYTCIILALFQGSSLLSFVIIYFYIIYLYYIYHWSQNKWISSWNSRLPRGCSKVELVYNSNVLLL